MDARVNSLDAHWMGFSNNRGFKANPRLVASAKDMHYFTESGRPVLDGAAGLWCVNAGHCREEIVEAIRRQAGELDFAPTFNLGHPLVFQLANRVAGMFPDGMGRVFFCNSGSEAVDSTLKIALAYQKAIGQGSRTRLIGRERGYHGVGFGGLSVGGMVNNRRQFGSGLPGVDHLRHTHDPAGGVYHHGQRETGADLADDLERLVGLHGADTIAAVIVEPVAGSTGVLVPPKNYLQRLRDIATKHGILLIFDEVITGFGRLGAPTASQYFGVTPDLISCAKGLTNAAVPMGAAVVGNHIYDAVVDHAPAGIEFFHGYTYGGHPLAAAAGLAALDLYENDGIFDNAKTMSAPFETAFHTMHSHRNVIDVRNIGIVGAVEVSPRPDAPVGARGMAIFHRCFDDGLLVRVSGDVIALSPPLILEQSHVDEMFDILGKAIDAVD